MIAVIAVIARDRRHRISNEAIFNYQFTNLLNCQIFLRPSRPLR